MSDFGCIRLLLASVMILSGHLLGASCQADDKLGCYSSVRLGFCALLNFGSSLARCPDVDHQCGVWVRNVGGHYQLPGNLPQEYSRGYGAVIIENCRSDVVSLPVIYAPEWFVVNIENGGRFMKSVPYISSRTCYETIALQPEERVAFLLGADRTVDQKTTSNLCVCCSTKCGRLMSNVMTTSWVPMKQSEVGLVLHMVKMGKAQVDYDDPLALAFSLDGEGLEGQAHSYVADTLLLLSNTSATNIVVKGFSSGSWNMWIERQGSRRHIRAEQFVSIEHQRDFVLEKGGTRALVLGVPSEFMKTDECEAVIHVEYCGHPVLR